MTCHLRRALVIHAHLSASSPEDTPQAQAASTWEGAQTFEVTGWSLAGVGVGTIVGGLVWYFTGGDSDSPAVRLDVEFMGHGGLVTLDAGF